MSGECPIPHATDPKHAPRSIDCLYAFRFERLTNETRMDISLIKSRSSFRGCLEDNQLVASLSVFH